MPRQIKKGPITGAAAAVTNAIKKTPAKAAPAQETIVLQFGASEWAITHRNATDLDALSADGKKKVTDLRIYLKPEEGMLYYVANGDITGKLSL